MRLKFKSERKELCVIICLMMIPLIHLFCFRALYVFNYVSLQQLRDVVGSLPLAIFNSWRFDMMVTAYIMVVAVLMVYLCRKIVPYYMCLASVILTSLGIADLCFYRNFNSHFNVTVFDFFNEGPADLVRAFWEEYPVGWFLLCVCATAALSFFCAKKIVHGVGHSKGWKKTLLSVLAWMIALFVFMRGSVTEFPLQIEDTIVSASEQVNDAVPNAVYMLKDAYKNKKNAFRFDDCNTLLSKHSFKSLEEALKTFNPNATLDSDTLRSLENALFAYQPVRSDTLSKPNVLVVLAESWSNYLMNLDSRDADMLYGMRTHFKEDILMRNFQSVCNGTVASIENVTMSTPFTRVFVSKYAYNQLPTSVALPFVNSGYECSFMTGMDQAWEHCGEALKHQGFSIVGKYELLKQHPDYTFNSIGVYDHHLFRSILETINKKEAKKPQMILAMTTTNHPPFVFPEDIRVQSLGHEFYKNKCFNDVGEEVLTKYITGYRYFNKVLGDFLTEFKKSPAANNTIVVITGDHNVRSILNYNVIGKRWQNSVPLYVYLPPMLREDSYPNVKEKWGCHYDILPTLAPLALSGTKYLKLGNDLLNDSVTLDNSYSYNQQQVLSQPSYITTAQRRSAAREVLLRLYFAMLLSGDK